jgi:hypothetical protein
MTHYEDEEDLREDDPQALPEARLDTPGPCCICGKPDCTHACFLCGKPVCMDTQNYQADSSCGSWIMDWWSNGADDPDDGNEFWCNSCLEEEKIAQQVLYEQEMAQRTPSTFDPDADDETWPVDQ